MSIPYNRPTLSSSAYNSPAYNRIPRQGYSPLLMPISYAGMPSRLAINTVTPPWASIQTSELFFSNPTKCNSDNNHHHIHLALWQMFKIAGAIFMVRGAFHLAPKAMAMVLKNIDKQSENVLKKSENQLLKQLGIGIKKFNQFFESRSCNPHGGHLFKSLMAIIDGVLMLYVGGEVDRYFSKKTDHFKPKNNKDPEKMVDKVILVLIATERIENLMHHLFHWIDPKPKSSRQFLYGELAALTAVLLDTVVKIASDRYKIKKNQHEETPQNSVANPLLNPIQQHPSNPFH